MKNAKHFLLLFCICILSAGCVATQPKVVDVGTENNSGIITKKQGPIETGPYTTAAPAKTTIIRDNPATEVNSISLAKPDLSGTWVLNRELSENPQEKINESRQQVGNTRGNKSMSDRRGDGQGGKGSGGKHSGIKNNYAGNKENGRRQESLPQELQAILKASETLELKHEEPLLTIITKDSQQRVYTDFRGTSVSVSGGMNQIITTAGWESDVLVVESTMNGGRFIQQFNLNAESRQLWVSTLISTSRLPKHIQFNRVYELLENGTEQAHIE